MTRRVLTLSMAALAFATIRHVNGQAGSPLDPNFQPPFFVTPSLAVQVTLLPDGSFVQYFLTDTLVEQTTGPLTHSFADGTLDTAFNFSRDYNNVTAVTPLTVGSLYVAAFQNPYGSFSAGTSTLLRVKSDGSIDTTFASGTKFGPHEIRGITVQTDGNILVGGHFGSYGSLPRSGIARVLGDGTPDSNFNSTAPQVIGGNGLWAKPTLQPADSKVLIGGDFTALGSTNFPGVARLNPDGSVDGSFVPTGFASTAPVRGIVVQSDGFIVLAGRFSVAGRISNAALIRLAPNGTIDPTFNLVGGLGKMRTLTVLSDGTFLATNQSVYHFAQNGSRDPTFHEPALLLDQSSATGAVGAFSINVRKDGKILVGGIFTDVDDEGVPFNGSRFGVARLNADGTLDTTFTTSHRTGIATSPSNFVRQPDGTTIISFSTANQFYPIATIPHNFGRLLPSGALDASFDPLAGQSDFNVASGFIQLGDGSFIVQSAVDPVTGDTKVIRVLPDGTLDLTFGHSKDNNPYHPQVSTGVRLADGSAIFLTTDPAAIAAGQWVQHRSAAGVLDTNYNIDLAVTNAMVVRDVSGQPVKVATTARLLTSYSNNRVLLGYLDVNGTFRLVRLTTSGGIDSSFAAGATPAMDLQNVPNVTLVDAATDTPFTITQVTSALGFADAEVSTGNNVVVVGTFAGYGASNARGIVRLDGAGAVDPSFKPGTGAEWRATPGSAVFQPLTDNVESQGDGKFIVTGTFEAFNGVTAPGIVRLNIDGSVDNSFVAPCSRNKLDSASTVYFKRQDDGSFLLGGPYLRPAQTVSPSFIHFFGPPVINSPLTAAATIGKQFIYQFEATGATSLNVSGLTGTGLSFNPALKIIAGVPSNSPATVSITLSASNLAGTTTATLTLTIASPASGPVITSSTSATGRTGAPFSFQVITTGGSPATQLSATNLPAGLTFDPVTGVISGTPQSEGSTAVNLVANDPSGSSTGILQLTFSADVGLPVIVSPDSALLSSAQQFSYTIVAPAASDPNDITTYNLIGTLPSGLSFDNKTGVISGTFLGRPLRDGGQYDRKPLSGGVISNVQLFATNSHGTSTTPLVFFAAPIGSVNISTRLAVGTADNVLIGGFIVTGNAPKKVLIRAIGPSLKAGSQPLAGALQDPMLDLYQGPNLLGSNDDWRSTQEAEIQATTIPPIDDRESAIIATLAPNTGYTAVIRGKNNSTGIALAEIYDLGTASLDNSSTSKLANISTRGTVLTADNVMIGGFIISGTSTKVLARAIGPSLINQGVAGALQDTLLELHDGSGALVVSNDDWRSDQEQQIKDTTVPPTDDRESAVVATLPPGNYTAVVRGKSDSTGVALVEVYSLQ